MIPNFIAGWLMLAVIVGFALVWASSVKIERNLKNALVLSAASLLISGIILSPVLILGGAGAEPLTDEQYEKIKIATNVRSAAPHTVNDKTITGFVTEIGDKVVVTSRLAVKERPQNELFYDYKIVDYEITTDADLQIGDEVAITRGVDGVFKFAGRIQKKAY